MLANLAASGVRARVSSLDKVFSGAAGFLWEGWILQIRYMSSDSLMQCLCLLFISLHFLQSFLFWSFLLSYLCLPPLPPHPKEQIYMSHSRSRDTNASVEFVIDVVFDVEAILVVELVTDIQSYLDSIDSSSS